MKLVMFSKKLIDLDFAGLARVLSDLGLDGVDLTVRPKGHILPEGVARDLPRAVEVMSAHDLEVAMLTTAVTSADEPSAEGIFRTASDCGIGFLKLGYWRYRGFGNIFEQLDEVREDLKGISRLAAEYGVVAGVHIHSGEYMSATADLVSRSLEGLDTENIGAYIDPGHMVLEGGLSGWRIGMDLLRGVIKMVAVKDFGWERLPGEPKRWRVSHLPLSEGMVPWKEVFAHLKEVSFDGPVSLHSEYEGMDPETVIAQTSSDLAYLREILEDTR
jgi:sugar phosphate isomerase/epimerase